MSGESRTIRVSGLPVDGSVNRLIDKLQIHFLRKKNGGGEISSVTVSQTLPGTAFITFDESDVALRLAQKGKQVLKVGDKSYNITISLHHEDVDVDKVLLSMSVVVDHTKLPGGRNTLMSLHESFPGVRLLFDDQKGVCALEGRYSEVQSLSSLVLESLEDEDPRSGDKPQRKTDSKKSYTTHLEEPDNSHLRVHEDPGAGKHTQLSEDLDPQMETESWKTGLPLPSGYSDHASHAALMEDNWDSAPDTGTSAEDFSLIVDSDIFRYLHKFCSKEYRSILMRHGVEVLDVSCDDITTLYLGPRTALSEHDTSSVKKAHQDLAHLYHQKESQLRKEHVYKHGIPEKELTHALESLRKKLPKLMIDEDDRNLYMVGSKNDVSEARQFIGDMRGFGMEKEIQSEHLFVPSQSKFTFTKQGSSSPSEPPGIPPSSFQDSHDLFMPKKDLQNSDQREILSENSSKRRHNSVEVKHFDDSPTGTQRIDKPTEDIFDLRRTEASQERHVAGDLDWMKTGGWLDRNKYIDSLVDYPKASSFLDANKSSFNKADFISETTELQSHLDTRVMGSEAQIKPSKVYKTKQTEPGKERKMAANFSKDLTSNKSEVPALFEGTYLKERTFPDSGQPHSLPLIKSSTNSSLDPNTLRSSASAETSTSKIDIQEHKGDMSKFVFIPYDKKPTTTPSCLSQDQGVKSSSSMPSGPTLRRSNSFSGKIKKGEDPMRVDVDLSAGQKGASQNVQTREIVAMDLVLSFRLYLYLRAVYNTEIENLTSDLQIKEQYNKEDVTLCLRGVDSEKVSECYRGLKSLVATAEKDFDSRTLPLSKLGVLDSKDKTLLELCTLMKQRYKMVKILLMSKDVMILGPKLLCDKVEAAVMKVFHEGGNITTLKLENRKSPKPDSLHTTAPDSELLSDHSTTSSKPHSNIIVKDVTKISDHSVAHSSKKTKLKSDQTRSNLNQDYESGSQNKMKGEKLDQLDTLIQTSGGNMHDKNDESSTSSAGVIKSVTKDEANGENHRDHTNTSAESKETSAEQMNPGISVDQIGDSQRLPGVSDPNNDILPSHTSRSQSLLLCYVCENEYSTVKQAACGFNFCPECEKEAHNNCRVCASSIIKGTMSIQESTITIPGFNRDTTLIIIYDIPDGIQGEDHPYPGAPFKGNRFEAYLPHNNATKKLLPLLEKAFHKGLTFTVKVGSSDDSGSTEGRVVWGSIPHKTRTEGGTSNNGYPDSNYIRRLDDALKAAGVGE